MALSANELKQKLLEALKPKVGERGLPFLIELIGRADSHGRLTVTAMAEARTAASEHIAPCLKDLVSQDLLEDPDDARYPWVFTHKALALAGLSETI